MQLNRRTFIEAVGAGALAVTEARPGASTQAATRADSLEWRRDFPALAQRVNGHPIAYLDSAATTQRPRAVIDAISRFYEGDNANPGATLHSLARRAAGHFGSARAAVARFLNAAAPSEVIFTKGTTEAINRHLNHLLRTKLFDQHQERPEYQRLVDKCHCHFYLRMEPHTGLAIRSNQVHTVLLFEKLTPHYPLPRHLDQHLARQGRSPVSQHQTLESRRLMDRHGLKLQSAGGGNGAWSRGWRSYSSML